MIGVGYGRTSLRERSFPPTIARVALSADVAALGFPREFPSLFGQLNDRSAHALHAALSNACSEGWEPTREDVADQVDVILGRITDEELVARAIDRARTRSVSPRRVRYDFVETRDDA